MDKQLSTLWKTILSEIETDVSRGNFLTLLKPTTLFSLEDNIATISAPSPMIIDLLQKRFAKRIKEAFATHGYPDVELLFVTKIVPKTDVADSEGTLFAQTQQPTPLPLGHLPRVRPDYRFDTLAVSGSNQLAWVSATTIAKNLGQMYNPFFMYGPTGVGKTHLMHAIANNVYQKSPEKKIIYITSEEFTNEVVEAIRNNQTHQMKKRFRSASLLMIDDIQFIAGKDRVQEELFHTFNILIDNGAQIVLSSDRPPQEIKKLEKRLSSRFAGGLTVDIEPPDFELKTAILLKKAEKFGFSLPMEVAQSLAEKAEDARSLEGLLLRVMTQAQSQDKEANLLMVEHAFGTAKKETEKRIHPDDIIANVCMFYNVKQTQLKGPKRDASLVRARQVAMYLLKHEMGLTYVEIGNMLGGRDHTTIMHGVEKVENMLKAHERVSADISGITKALHG